MTNHYKKSREIFIHQLEEEGYKVEKFIEEVCDLFNINNTYFGNILVAVNEAVTNAFIHGNQRDVKKRVTIKFSPVAKGLSFVIKDEGQGFDLTKIPNPIQELSGQFSDQGKGVFLMSHLADEIRYNKKGNQVELLFWISSINYETSLYRMKTLRSYFQTSKVSTHK